MESKRVQKLVTFSPKLYSLLKTKAERLGMGFAEYLRFLAVNDLKNEVPKNYSDLKSF